MRKNCLLYNCKGEKIDRKASGIIIGKIGENR